jgi:hypothetical protein
MPNPRHDKLVQEIGRAGVHALFPNDFEYYMVILELVDSLGSTVDFLAFPVAPERYMHEDPGLVNIKKTLGGISALDTETFRPKTITMSGTFGRKFKLLLSKPVTNAENAVRSTDGGLFGKVVNKGMQIKSTAFDPKLKTGYGTLKILESIVDKSHGLDNDNEPFRLYLYVPALNHSWLVKVNKFAANQDRTSSNMMWRYDLTMTAIAQIDSLVDKAKEELSDLTEEFKLNKKSEKHITQTRKERRYLKKAAKHRGRF